MIPRYPKRAGDADHRNIDHLYDVGLEPLDSNKYYPATYLAGRYGCHPITIWKWVAKGILPRPTKLGPNTTRWLGAVIEQHERRRAETGNAK
jgi:predicted DNA-binding transcriptional regulator AlpA